MPKRSEKRDTAKAEYIAKKKKGEEVSLRALAGELGVKPNPAQLESGGQVGRSVTQEKARRAAGQPKQQGQAQCGGQPRRCAARQ